MEFSRDWLAEYVDLPDDAELADGLTGVGLSVEGREERDGDVLLDVDVTTNRPDCMCHLGLAREVAVRFERPLVHPRVELEESSRPAAEAAAVDIVDAEGCPRYAARVIEGVAVGPSPEWLRRRLEAIGLRPINNIVDVTNYVLWETGQPLHAFDLDKLAESRLIVRRAAAGETLVTLDGERRELDPEILVIADAARPVALAGIMGGLDSEVVEGTTRVLIESAHFDPRTVRRGAARLGMHTDASHRFERGSDPEGPPRAAARAAALMAELAGGTVLRGAIDETTDALPGPLAGTLDRRRLVGFGGVEIGARTVERILDGLGFATERRGDDVWRVTVPSWRTFDMAQTRADGSVYEADLFEEVLRHIGFDNVPSALPPVTAPDEGSSAGHDLREIIRHHLAACGLAEAVNYAFHSADEAGKMPGLWADGEPLRLANPLSELYDTMRRSLVPGLLGSAHFNQRRGAEAVRLFEMGHLFPGGEAEEVEVLAVVAGGAVGTPWERRHQLDVFDLKGWLESLAARLGVRLETRPAELEELVPGTGATLHLEGEPPAIGWLGQLADAETGCPLYAAELETRALAAGSRFVTVEAPSRYPGVAADLTLTHSLEVPWSDLDAVIAAERPADLVSWQLKVRYQGEGVPEGAVNTTITFLYNSSERSLTQEEVNERHQALSRLLNERFGTSGL